MENTLPERTVHWEALH